MSAFLNRFVEPAAKKPQIGSLSQEHMFLGVILLLIAVEIGMSLGRAPSRPSEMNVNFMVAGLLLMNNLAFGFRWSQPVTICLRVGSICMVVLTFMTIFHSFR
jgi:hypothetical protein